MFNPNELNKSYELEGLVRVQVHYYEDGNVQLVTSKEIKESIEITVRAFFAVEPLNRI